MKTCNLLFFCRFALAVWKAVKSNINKSNILLQGSTFLASDMNVTRTCTVCKCIFLHLMQFRFKSHEIPGNGKCSRDRFSNMTVFPVFTRKQCDFFLLKFSTNVKPCNFAKNIQSVNFKFSKKCQKIRLTLQLGSEWRNYSNNGQKVCYSDPNLKNNLNRQHIVCCSVV